jgi:hypothetical protein
MTDRRRYGVIEVRRHNADTYHLTIDGELWSEVEWSPSRQAWCIQDAAGQCLTHVERAGGCALSGPGRPTADHMPLIRAGRGDRSRARSANRDGRAVYV